MKPARIRFFSLKQSPINCTPIGSPSESLPQGTLNPGSPARFKEIVYISPRYILIGSDKDEPIFGAVVGATGPIKRSYFAKVSSKAFLIRAFTLNALR